MSGGIKNALKMVILGAPGSGKGTISERIVRDFGLVHLSTGDLLRVQIAKKTDFGLKAKSFIDSGKLLPDDLMIQFLVSEMGAVKGSSLLLDGFPRTKAQAESLSKRETLDVAVNLDVPDEVIVDRIKGRWIHPQSGRIYNTEFNPPKVAGKDDVTGEDLIQREDDKAEVVLKRLATYHATTKPVLEVYRNLGILQEFHGRESNEIWPRVHSFLSRFVIPKSGPF